MCRREVLDDVASPEAVGDRLVGSDAITVVEVTHLFDNEVGAQGYVVPAGADASPMRSYPDRDLAGWANANGAVDFLRAASEGRYCQWRYRLDYLADGGRHSMTLAAPGGKPFAVTGPLTDQAGYAWVVTSPATQSCWGPESDRLARWTDRPTPPGAPAADGPSQPRVASLP